MLQLACGIMVEPGMTRDQLLALPEVKGLIHKMAYDHSVECYESQLHAVGHDEAFWGAADDYNCTALELQSKIVYAVRNCAVRRAERELENRASAAIMNLVWQQMRSNGEYALDSDEWGDDDPEYIWAPGNDPHYAGDCQDCHHPNHRACSACSEVIS